MIDASRPLLIDETADGWLVSRDGEDAPLSRFAERDEAVSFAAGIARAAGGGTILIHGHDGRFDVLGISEGATELDPRLVDPG